MTTFNTGDVAANAHRRANMLKVQIDAFEIELAREKRILAAAGSGKHTTPNGTFTVSENNVYEDAAILAVLSTGQARRVQTLKLDKAKVKALYPEAYAGAKNTRGFKVSL